MVPGERIWAAAVALVGTPFRLHGRAPATGLDCVGLALAACSEAGLWRDGAVATAAAPDRYRLQDNCSDWAESWLAKLGLMRRPAEDAGVGDILLCRPSPRQLHLLIGGVGAHIHADAGLRRVVLTPGAPRMACLSRWRAAPLINLPLHAAAKE